MPETTALLDQKWDMIFFTGSPQIGKIVHQAAAKNLTPAVLELGGKNPTIVHSSANIRSAARRIAYSRFINSGPHLHRPGPRTGLAGGEGRVCRRDQGRHHRVLRRRPQAEPRLRASHQRPELTNASWAIWTAGPWSPEASATRPSGTSPPLSSWTSAVDSPIMQDEVFGPIIPVLEIDSVDAVIEWVNSHPRPLGLYVFAEDETVAEHILERTGSGDACVNDCSIQPLMPELPFGGVGNSGMGKYHGHWGFEAFTNARGVLYHGAKLDPGVKYPPYSEHERSTGSSPN